MKKSPHSPLLTLTSSGLYCPQADVYLDPWRPVARALITHAHSDHARPGSERYVTQHVSVPLLHHRLGTTPAQVRGVEYGETLSVNGVHFSFHPAGHVPGSSQILVESHGERWVFSGDYKLEADGVCTPFEAVPCDTFISECTFGLPVFRWEAQSRVFSELHSWWRENLAAGYSSVITAYALGKAQRLMAHLDTSVSPVVVHSAVWSVCEALGVSLDGFERWSPDLASNRPVLVVAPPAVIGTPWLKRFAPYRTGTASGWMAIRGMKRRRGIDKGFVLSDHADFHGLVAAIRATGAERVLLTHGYTAQFGRYLQESYLGLDVQELGAQYVGEEE
jgi:putative mRNA 3-end processing factor